jgi:dienelactone hydrolase
MHEETIPYKLGNLEMKGYLAYDSSFSPPRPGILVAHAWRGLDDFAKEKARELAKLGYVAFAADVYGQGTTADTDEKALALMQPLFFNRKELRQRIGAAYDVLAKQPQVDRSKLGAIGFCFGGMTVIELLRDGRDLRGVVSFHGILGRTLKDKKAELAPNAPHLKGSLLILNGHDDPLVKKEDVEYIQKEFTEAKVDWQLHDYGHVVHAFTNPQVTDVKTGMAYNAKAARRSWQSMVNFFEEVFNIVKGKES